MHIKAFWDEEAQVWVAESEVGVGLCTEAPTLELLSQKIPVMLADLGIDSNTKIHLEAHRELALSA
jgi:Domain of unknown function (DUF1902)